MSGVRVEPSELRRHAAAVNALPWIDPVTDVSPADQLSAGTTAASNLTTNAQMMLGFNKFAKQEGDRIAEMLNIAAQAYEDVDEACGKQMSGEREAAVDAIPVPSSSVPMPTIPADIGGLATPTADGYSDVEATQQALTGGDQGTSLQVVTTFWAIQRTHVLARSEVKMATGNWEGEAANAAYERMNTYDEWLGQLSAAWDRLSAAAAKVEGAHTAALDAHTPIATAYTQMKIALEAEVAKGWFANGDKVKGLQAYLAKLQELSDEVRHQHAQGSTFDKVKPGDPPFGNPSGPTSTPVGPSSPQIPSSTGGSPGGTPAGGTPTSMSGLPTNGSQTAERPATEAPAAAQSAGGSPSSGGSPSGQSGGQSGGSPSTGGLPTGLGRKPGDLSQLKETNLQPASADIGGAGAGAGGGAGGGAGATPLQPAVGADSVAAGPAQTRGGAGGAVPAAAMGGALGGAMGPMGHGAGHGHGGKEKKRNPSLAPDEELYTEDREWTEAVIGNRRRRGVDDRKGGEPT